MKDFFLVFVGSGLGGISRFGISKLFQFIWPSNFPIATLVANLFSCLLLGVTLYQYKSITDEKWFIAFLIIGYCGGLSTFSTFSHETFRLIENGNVLWAMLNILFNIVLCLIILFLCLSHRGS